MSNITAVIDLLVLGTLKASIIVGLGALTATLLRNASSAMRHMVWALTLASVLLVPAVATVVPAWTIARMPSLTRTWSGAATASAAAHAATVARHESTPAATNVAPVTPPATSHTADVATRFSPAPRPTHDVTRLASRPLVARWELLPLAWLLGVLLVMARSAIARWRLSRLTRRSIVVTDASWRALVATLARELGISRPVTLRTSPDVRVPMTWGTRTPVVMLPADTSAWPEPRRRVVLVHELTHVRRFDTLTLALAQLTCTLHWFNPLVWNAARQMRREAECATDDAVLRSGARASAYADDLLDIARHAIDGEQLAPAALAMARRSQLEGRLLAILDPARRRSGASRLALAGAALTAVAVTGALAAARPPEHEATRPRGVTKMVVSARPAGEVAPPQVVEEPPAVPATPAAAPSTAVVTVPPVAAPSAVAAVDAVDDLLANADHSSSSHSHSSSWSVNDAGGRSTWRGGWSDASGSAKVRAEGTIEFNRDGTDIASISDGGYFRLEVEQNGHTRRLEVEPHAGGLTRALYVDGKERPWDAEARAWLANALVEMDQSTGILIEQRFPLMMSEGGPNRVLDEISRMTSDYVKGLYFARLLDAKLDRPPMRRALTQAGREIDSDYELAKVLSKAVERDALDDPDAHAPFLTATNAIESDYEHARVLMMIVSRKDMTSAEATTALRSATSLSSDYERSRVLTALAARGPLGAAGVSAYIESASKLSSDYERGRSLKALLDSQVVDKANVPALIHAAEGMSSDYERANLLVRIVDRARLDDSGREAYRRAARGISSDYERNRALAALGGAGDN